MSNNSRQGHQPAQLFNLPKLDSHPESLSFRTVANNDSLPPRQCVIKSAHHLPLCFHGGIHLFKIDLITMHFGVINFRRN